MDLRISSQVHVPRLPSYKQHFLPETRLSGVLQPESKPHHTKAFSSHVPPLPRALVGPMTPKTHRSYARQDTTMMVTSDTWRQRKRITF